MIFYNDGSTGGESGQPAKKVYPMYLPKLSKEELERIVSEQDWLARFVWRFGNGMFVLFGLGAAVFLLTIEMPVNDGFLFSLKVLCVPFGAVIFGYTWAKRDFLYTVKGLVGTRVIACLAYPMLLLWGWPYVMALNALTGTGEKIVCSGRITAKWMTNGVPEAQMLETATQRKMVLHLSQAEYDALQPGAPYAIEFQRGGFGFPYKWMMPQRGHR